MKEHKKEETSAPISFKENVNLDWKERITKEHVILFILQHALTLKAAQMAAHTVTDADIYIGQCLRKQTIRMHDLRQEISDQVKDPQVSRLF